MKVDITHTTLESLKIKEKYDVDYNLILKMTPEEFRVYAIACLEKSDDTENLIKMMAFTLCKLARDANGL